MSQRIFISSVQREFAKERKALAEYVRKDAILGRFFDVFLLEEVSAPEWYEDDPDDFRVVLKRPVPDAGAEKTEQESRVKSSVKTRVKSSGVDYKKVPRNG